MRVLRCLLVLLAATAGALGGVALLLPGLGDPRRGASATDAVVWLATLGLLACLMWFWACTVAVTLEVLGRRPAPGLSRHAPDLVRRLVFAACGVALGAGAGLGLALPAGATPGALHLDHEGDRAGRTTSSVTAPAATGTTGGESARRLDGLPFPAVPIGSRGADTAAPRTGHAPPAGHEAPRQASYEAGRAAPAAPATDGGRHRVLPGESLWSITADLLGPEADDAAVAAAWPLLHRANADLIGPDPDVLHAGVLLTLPTALERTAQ